MNYELQCPICSEKNWYQTGTRIHKASDEYWRQGYPAIQKTVFFELWHKNATAVESKRFVCRRCGFVTDIPRPSEDQLKDKYGYLAEVEKDLGSSRSIPPKIMRLEHNQALGIFNLAKRYFNNNTKSLDILDYGGGAGHFLIPMVKKGHNCYLIDYNKNPFHGIIRLGDTLDDIPKGKKFDFIICRHVLEHVASPTELIAGFKQYLKSTGIVYAEVPIELLGAVKPGSDPVTHINYFQKDSFTIMFEKAGFSPIISRQKLAKYHGDNGVQAQVLVRMGCLQENIISNRKSFKHTILLIRHPIRIRMRYPLPYAQKYIHSLKGKIIVKFQQLFW